MTLFNHIDNFFLYFAHFPELLLIVLIGFFWISRPLFFQVLCISACNITLNVALKGTFKVPLAASLGKVGYAFPSGHMELATVFYVWLAIHIASKWFRMSVLILLVGIGMSLMHHGYHNLEEVLAGLGVGLLWVGACKLMLGPRFALFLLGCSSLCMVYNICIYALVPMHAWAAYITLLVSLLVNLKCDYLSKGTLLGASSRLKSRIGRVLKKR